MKVEKSKKIKEKDVRSTTSKQFRIKKSGKKRKSGTDKRRRGKMEEKKKDWRWGLKEGEGGREEERERESQEKAWKSGKSGKRVGGGGGENEGTREITLSPTLTRGSYESRGGRNPDYCSPDYNITRTDRSTRITGDSLEIAPPILSTKITEEKRWSKDHKNHIVGEKSTRRLPNGVLQLGHNRRDKREIMENYYFGRNFTWKWN